MPALFESLLVRRGLFNSAAMLFVEIKFSPDHINQT